MANGIRIAEFNARYFFIVIRNSAFALRTATFPLHLGSDNDIDKPSWNIDQFFRGLAIQMAAHGFIFQRGCTRLLFSQTNRHRDSPPHFSVHLEDKCNGFVSSQGDLCGPRSLLP
jgi:hypothetical protein